ncbi:hypothetical protein VO54_03688 [Elizabethkingia miricola]|nr:hypothetical protein VO54_03688 [Elizabethkingia miricola]
MENYTTELNQMLEKAINKMKRENPDFIIYTTSIWTDREASISAISFDNKKNAFQKIEKLNEWEKRKHEEYLSKDNLRSAELFKPAKIDRLYNPADFELSGFEEFEHNSVPFKWYNSLLKFGKIAFETIIKELNVDSENFELGINSTKDWYNKSWKINSKK